MVKGNLWGNCKFLLEQFKGSNAMARGHGGNRLQCLHEVSDLNNLTNLCSRQVRENALSPLPAQESPWVTMITLRPSSLTTCLSTRVQTSKWIRTDSCVSTLAFTSSPSRMFENIFFLNGGNLGSCDEGSSCRHILVKCFKACKHKNL